MPCFSASLQPQESAKRKGHFALYNCLVLGHTKNNLKGVQRIYCNPFPAKPFYGSDRLDFVMIRPPGIDHGAFQSGMPGYYSFFCLCYNRHWIQVLRTRTCVKSDCRCWKHTTIPRMVIIGMILIIDIIVFIAIILIMSIMQDV
jgi:hypothetical protein